MDEETKKALKHLKADIRGLVMSDPNLMDLNKLVKDYRNTIGCAIPVGKFGYTNILTFLQKECTDVIRFSGSQFNPFLTPIVTAEVKHVNDLIYKQKPSANRRTPRRNIGIIQTSFQSGYTNNRSPHSYNNNSHTNDYSRPKAHSNGYSNPYRANSTPHSPKKHNTYNATSDTKQSKAIVPCSPSSSSTKSSNTSQMSEGVNATKEFEEYPKNHKVTTKIIDNMKQLMANHPNGLWCRELVDKYQAMYKNDFQPFHLGYNVTSSMCKDMPMVFKMTRPKKLGDFRLFTVNATIPPEYQDGAGDAKKVEEVESKKTNANIDELVFGSQALPGVKCDPSLYPDDCAAYGETLSDPLPVQDAFVLMISEVRDPSNFWFQVVSNSGTCAVDTLMNDMTEFYYNNPASPKYTMVRAAAKTGQLCAVPYGHGGRYHRAVIIKNISWRLVKVFYVDYGTVADIEFEKVKMLLNIFCDVAAQARRGRLGGVTPKGGRWSGQAKTRFMELIPDESFQARVLHRVKEDHLETTTLELIDIYHERNMSKLLISEGLALPDDQHDAVKPYFLSFYNLENDIDNGNAKENNEPTKELEDNLTNEKKVKSKSDLSSESNSLDSLNSSLHSIDDKVKLTNTEQVDCELNLPAKIQDSPVTNIERNQDSPVSDVDRNLMQNIYRQRYTAGYQHQTSETFLNPSQMNYPYVPEAMLASNMNHMLPQVPYMPMMDMSQAPLPMFPFYNNMNIPRPYMPLQVNYNLQNIQKFAPFPPHLEPSSPIRPKRMNFPINHADNSATERAQLDAKPLVEIKTKDAPCEDVNIRKENTNRRTEIGEHITNNLKAVNLELFKDLKNTECKLVFKSIDSIPSENKYSNELDDIEPLSSDEEEVDDVDTKPNMSLNIDEYQMTLIDIVDMFGESLEIWNMKDKSFVMLQQCAKAFLTDTDNKIICEHFQQSDTYNYIVCTLLQDNGAVVTDILSKIRENGRSGAKKDDVITLINNQIVDTDKPYLILVPIERLLEVLCTDFENVKHDILDLMHSTLELYKKYVPSGSEASYTESDSDDESIKY